MGFNLPGAFLTTAIEAILRHWSDLSPRLDAPAWEEVTEILAGAETDPIGAARDLRELVKPFTPPGHPAREALAPPGVRYQPTVVAPPSDSGRLLGLLQELRAELLGTPAEAVGGTAPPLVTAAVADSRYRPDADDAWLLATPTVPASSVDLTTERNRDLILLTDENEVELIPTFQFDPESGAPHPVVIEINRLLSADEDPWGAVDWWLATNVWLDAAPAGLLGTGADSALLSAARAETPDW
ncbi:hypothetical protein ABZZ36_39720 [Actinacidiphila glaucinigra]|uniref:hypothetical protein n=1 Tax=Actinacidiphila glaucinigra TaxID=235986 RepID=UPI0033BBAB31